MCFQFVTPSRSASHVYSLVYILTYTSVTEVEIKINTELLYFMNNILLKLLNTSQDLKVFDIIWR